MGRLPYVGTELSRCVGAQRQHLAVTLEMQRRCRRPIDHWVDFPEDEDLPAHGAQPFADSRAGGSGGGQQPYRGAHPGDNRGHRCHLTAAEGNRYRDTAEIGHHSAGVHNRC